MHCLKREIDRNQNEAKYDENKIEQSDRRNNK